MNFCKHIDKKCEIVNLSIGHLNCFLFSLSKLDATEGIIFYCWRVFLVPILFYLIFILLPFNWWLCDQYDLTWTKCPFLFIKTYKWYLMTNHILGNWHLLFVVKTGWRTEIFGTFLECFKDLLVAEGDFLGVNNTPIKSVGQLILFRNVPKKSILHPV